MSRAVQLAPLMFAVAGAGLGICVAMLIHNKPPFRVPIDDGAPLALLGVLFGAVAGHGVVGGCLRRPHMIRPAGLAAFAVLAAAITAPLGWIAGTVAVTERMPRGDSIEDVRHLPPLGMVAGAGIGCVMGVALGVLQMRLDRRGRRN